MLNWVNILSWQNINALRHSIWKKLSRKIVLTICFFLPQDKKKAIERWIRGREEYRKMCLTNYMIISWGKSGRTWLRLMISRFYQVKFSLSERDLIGFDNLHRKNSAIPKLFFSHGNYLQDYTKNRDSKIDYYDKKIVLLVRDPRDVAVSQFFQWKYRMRPRKKLLNDYPPHGKDVSIFDFVMHQGAGLPKIINFMNAWQRDLPNIKEILIVRYEDLRTAPEKTLSLILDFVGTSGSLQHITEAVEFASYDNMKKMEQKKVFWLSGGRLVPRDRANPDSYKVRRAKVGGYRDYFNDRQIAEIDRLVRSTLAPSFGYSTDADTNRERAATI